MLKSGSLSSTLTCFRVLWWCPISSCLCVPSFAILEFLQHIAVVLTKSHEAMASFMASSLCSYLLPPPEFLRFPLAHLFYLTLPSFMMTLSSFRLMPLSVLWFHFTEFGSPVYYCLPTHCLWASKKPLHLVVSLYENFCLSRGLNPKPFHAFAMKITTLSSAGPSEKYTASTRVFWGESSWLNFLTKNWVMFSRFLLTSAFLSYVASRSCGWHP